MKESKFQIDIKELQLKLNTSSNWHIIIHLINHYLINYCDTGIHEFLLYKKGVLLLPILMSWFSKNYNKCSDVCGKKSDNNITKALKEIDEELLPLQQALYNKWRMNDFHKLRMRTEARPLTFSRKLYWDFLKDFEKYDEKDVKRIKTLLGLNEKSKKNGKWRKK